MPAFKRKKAGDTPDRTYQMHAQVCVIGGGPAGLMAAIQAARAGAEVILLEAKAAWASKLKLTGAGRCNLLHQGSPAQILAALRPKDRFLRHAIYSFAPQWVIRSFHSMGLGVVIGEDGRAFPASNRACDVADALVRAARTQGVRLLPRTRVTGIRPRPGSFLISTSDMTLEADSVILATGGLSYPQTGSTGDGLRMASRLGHSIVPPRPGLVPLITRQTWPGTLAGVSLDQVTLTIQTAGHRSVVTGPLVFTCDGIGGPAALDLSRLLPDRLPSDQGLEVLQDLRPDQDPDAIDRTIVQSAATAGGRQLLTCLSQVMPRRLAKVVIEQAGADPTTKAGQLSRDCRARLVRSIKALKLSVIGTRPIEQAMITLGGVATDQVDPMSMQSLIHPRLYFAGEILDVDGPSGGYNLQICWSTGALAGHSAAMAVSIKAPAGNTAWPRGSTV